MPEQKIIKYGGQTLELPAGMSLEDAKQQMARFFPELSEPKVETKKDGDKTTYVFSKQAGRKGTDSPLPKPTHVYIARKKCGCVVGVVTDLSDKWTGESVAEFIESGYTIERIDWQTYREKVCNESGFLGCIHKNTQLALAGE